MWTLWTQGLGRPSSEFWELTPREVFAAIEYHNEHERLLNYRAGIPGSAIYNVYRDKKSDPVQPLDFFEAPKNNSSPQKILGALNKLARNAERKRERKNGKPR